MTLKNNLESIVRKLDNAYLAWGLFVVGRLGDNISTAVNYEMSGHDISQERNPLSRFFMENMGFYSGSIAHELVGTIGLIGIYKLLGYTPLRNYRNEVPYVVCLSSVGATLFNTLTYL